MTHLPRSEAAGTGNGGEGEVRTGVSDAALDLTQAGLASCSRVVGEAFFPLMVETIARLLSVRWVLLSTTSRSQEGKASTVAVWDNGPAENFTYDLAHSPCENILSQGACCYPSNLCDRFPADDLLRDMGAQSYVGTPLRSSSGEVFGLLSALDDKPIEQVEQAKEVVEAFSGRAAAELERLATSSLNERLGRIVENSVSEVYVFDGDTYRFDLVNRGARDNLGYSMDELRKLTPWDLKPEISRDAFIDMVRPLKDGEVPALLFETVHQRKDGSLYDVGVQLQYFPGVENIFYASINDITDRKRAEEARAHLAAIVKSSDEAIISKGLDGTIRSWNQGAEKIFGFPAEEMIGRSIRAIIPPERMQEEDEILARIRRADKVSNYETVRLCRDGRPVDVSVSVSPILDSAGEIIGASKIVHDISERKAAETRERLLMGEVNHRSKNMLALVQVIARQTAANDAETFASNFEERIFALSASHDVLVNNRWKSIPLDELVRSQLRHFHDSLGSRIRLSGTPVEITAPAAQGIGMAIHELATNAAKYGALSNDSGTIDIGWTVEPDGDQRRFRFEWIERGGPPTREPGRSGFGSAVVDRILKAQLGGKVDIDWPSTGLVYRLSCPAGAVLDDHPGDAVQAAAAAAREEPATGVVRRVLVVEDEVLIGVHVAEMLADAGFDVLGPATTIGEALKILENQPCDAAVLDINLGNQTSAPIAEYLSAHGTPYLSVSGRSRDDRPQSFDGSPHLSKPIQRDLLVDGLKRLVGTGASATG